MLYFCRVCGLLFKFYSGKKIAEYLLDGVPQSVSVETDRRGNPVECPHCKTKMPEVCEV